MSSANNVILPDDILAVFRRIFWIDAGRARRSIESSKLTGADRQMIVRGSGNIASPVGLCTDVDRRRLYWSDREYGTISMSDYDGNNLRHFTLPRSYASSVVGLSIDKVSAFSEQSKSIS